jgi:acetylornithine deacetylase/succinyl-diaminopimelate desuccinylase-like protein
MTNLTTLIDYARSQRDRYLAEYKNFIAIPSVSTLSEHKPDMQRAADWVAGQMTGLGLKHVGVNRPPGIRWCTANGWSTGQPTVLVMGTTTCNQWTC